MKVTAYSFHKFETKYFSNDTVGGHSFKFLDVSLTAATAQLADGSRAVCIFVSDDASRPVLQILKNIGVEFLVLRSAGYNNVDLAAAAELGIRVARVPEYSPYAVAEHAVALMLALNRHIIRAHNRVTDLNFTLDGLVGFDMHGKTVGLLGTGKIGSILAKIMHGFGCKIIATDLKENLEIQETYGVTYVDRATLCSQSDVISLHLPLTEPTKHIIGKKEIEMMKPGVMLINTSRGALINTVEVIAGLKSGQIGFLGIDVYESEGGLFFEDHSDDILHDDIISRLMTFNNVLITSHQGFLTQTALENIFNTTVQNLDFFETGGVNPNEIK
jgi:D-lactate dehydrogenase